MTVYLTVQVLFWFCTSLIVACFAWIDVMEKKRADPEHRHTSVNWWLVGLMVIFPIAEAGASLHLLIYSL
jgi:hypothetical protein